MLDEANLWLLLLISVSDMKGNIVLVSHIMFVIKQTREREKERDKTEGNSELILIYIKSTSTILKFNLLCFYINTTKKTCMPWFIIDTCFILYHRILFILEESFSLYQY